MKALASAILFVAFTAHSQQPVYRCEIDGKVSYSDAPCVGAKRVDVTPTRGLDKSTGVTRKGADVRREEQQEAMSKALKPLLGETPAQYAIRHRRSKLGESERRECYALDDSIARIERTSSPQADADLYTARKRFFDLRC